MPIPLHPFGNEQAMFNLLKTTYFPIHVLIKLNLITLYYNLQLLFKVLIYSTVSTDLHIHFHEARISQPVGNQDFFIYFYFFCTE